MLDTLKVRADGDWRRAKSPAVHGRVASDRGASTAWIDTVRRVTETEYDAEFVSRRLTGALEPGAIRRDARPVRWMPLTGPDALPVPPPVPEAGSVGEHRSANEARIAPSRTRTAPPRARRAVAVSMSDCLNP
jgi:hypothetical protein